MIGEGAFGKEVRTTNPNLTTQEAERLVRTYSDLILRLSDTYLKNTQDAQDICQTVFLKFVERPRRFASPDHEKAWIIRVTVNACKDQLKSGWRKTSVPLEDAAPVPAPEREDGSLLAAVEALPAHYRLVIYLYYYEGYAAKEIARLLGVPAATVHTRLARARSKLRKELESEGYE